MRVVSEEFLDQLANAMNFPGQFALFTANSQRHEIDDESRNEAEDGCPKGHRKPLNHLPHEFGYLLTENGQLGVNVNHAGVGHLCATQKKNLLNLTQRHDEADEGSQNAGPNGQRLKGRNMR